MPSLSDIKVINQTKIVYDGRIYAELQGFRARDSKGRLSSSTHGFTIDGEYIGHYSYRKDAIRDAKVMVLGRIKTGSITGTPIVYENVGRPVSVFLGSTRMLKGEVTGENENVITIKANGRYLSFSKKTHYKLGERRNFQSSSTRFRYDDINL